MSYKDGWAALNLEMPARVPHTEYSVESHWEVVRRVTGIDVGPFSPVEIQQKASFAFMQAWNLDFRWSTLIGKEEFGQHYTDMGHAEYAEGGVDRRDTIFSLFATPEDALSLEPYEVFGKKDHAELVRRFETHYKTQCEQTPDMVNMTGIYTSMISGLIDILGWDMLLLAAGVDKIKFGELANRYAGWISQYFTALGEADVPVVMIHDDIVWSSGPFISPKWYRDFIFPNYQKLFEPLRDSGKKIVFTSDGNYTMFVDDLVKCGVNCFVMEPMTEMQYIADKYGKTHAFIGNADTRILLTGTKEDIRAEVERCMRIGKQYPGYFLAVGNHIPSNTPVDNVFYYEEVYEELSKR